MKLTVILAMVFVFSLMAGYPDSAGASDITLSVGDNNADTFADEVGDGDDGKIEKKAKKNKGKKGKKGKKAKNGKKGKKGKKGKGNKDKAADPPSAE